MVGFLQFLIGHGIHRLSAMPGDATGLDGFALSHVSWWGPVLGRPPQRMAHAPQIMLAQFLRLLVAVGTDATHHIGKMVGSGFVAGGAGVFTIRVVEAYRGIERHQESGISVTVLGGPLDGLWTARARHPDRRVGFLDRQYPGIHYAEVIVLSLPAKWPWPGPGSQHQIVAFFET